MAKLDLAIGGQVHCTDKHCGRLVKVIVDASKQQASDLILEQGLLFKTLRVVPVTVVAKTTPGEIYLNVPSGELDTYAEYREAELREPTLDAEDAPPVFDRMPVDSSITPAGPAFRKLARSVRNNGRAVLDHRTAIENLSEDLGRVDHVVLDGKTGRIVELVMRRGFFPGFFVVPMESVEEITDDVVLVSFFEDEVDGLPRYELRPDADLVADLEKSLQGAVPPVFKEVQVTANAGTIWLSGHVASDELKLHADELAYLVTGVVDVRNDLVVNGVKRRNEMAMKSQENLVYQIGSALAADPRTKNAVIEVIDDRGVITLLGEVPSVKTRHAAEGIAAHHNGVATVINELVVTSG